jgi:hypothetical protein
VPSSIGSVQAEMLGHPGAKQNRLLIFIFAVVSWVLRRTRNDSVFANILVNHPKHIAHRAFGFLYYCSQLSSMEARREMEIHLKKLHSRLQQL